MTHEANKQGKISEITASTEILRDTIHGFKKGDENPE